MQWGLLISYIIFEYNIQSINESLKIPKDVFRRRKLQDRQYNDKKQMDKKTNNDLYNTA